MAEKIAKKAARKNTTANYIVGIFFFMLIMELVLGASLLLAGIIHLDVPLIFLGAFLLPLPIMSILWIIVNLLPNQEN